jgi:hypothetical protein
MKPYNKNFAAKNSNQNTTAKKSQCELWAAVIIKAMYLLKSVCRLEVLKR